MACEQGHPVPHPTRVCDVSLRKHGYHDYPQVPERLWDSSARWFSMELLNPTGLVQSGGYCPAFGPLQHNVFHVGAWEPCETIALLDLSERLPDHVFVDFGANVGWFSVIMGKRGHHVHAIEGDPEMAEVLTRNLVRNEVQDYTIYGEMIGPGAWSLGVSERMIVKADVEGAEIHAINMLDLDLVDALLIEMSPVFNDTYYTVADRLERLGFLWAELPEKSVPPPKFGSIRDLAWRKDRLDARLDEVDQINVLFAREEAS